MANDVDTTVATMIVHEDGHTLFDVLEFFYRDRPDAGDYDDSFSRAMTICDKLSQKG